jgi:hypothetical protein
MALPVTFVAGDVLEAAQLNSNFTRLPVLAIFMRVFALQAYRLLAQITIANKSRVTHLLQLLSVRRVKLQCI